MNSTVDMQIPALTGIRGFAAFAVMLFHFTTDGQSPLAPWFVRGYLGVDLFFVLSGFIMQHVYRVRFSNGVSLEQYGTFLRFRLARIYPVHLVTTLAMLVLYFGAVMVMHRTPEDAEGFSPTAVAAALTLTQGWFGLPSPNIPSWSVSAEWFAYLFFPAACLAFARMGSAAKVAIVLASLVVVGFWGALHPLFRISPEFLLGMAAYDLTRGPRLHRSLGLLSLGAILVASFLPYEALALRASLFALLIAALSDDRDILAGLLARPIFVYLGEISYSVYMTHGIVWAITKNLARSAHWPPSSLVVVCMSIVTTLALSAFCHLWIEVPARHLLTQGTRRPALP